MQKALATVRLTRTLAATSFLLVGLAIGNWPTNARAQTVLPSDGTQAVPTYESAGLYWTNPAGTSGCEVKYRKAGESAWNQGLAMWFDARNSECRGSLVHLAPNTQYQVEFNLPGQAAARALEFRTWANQLPVAQTVTVDSGAGTLNITQGGSAATGYVVYQGAAGAVLDANNAAQFNVTVNASHVILRGLTLKGAQQDAIRISPNVKDVVIEDNDISGWGRLRTGIFGADMDSAIRAVCSTPTLERVTIQRNKIHDPRYTANSWSDGHPQGPQAVTISYCGGNHVIRHNEMYSTTGRYFNDIIGGEDNFTNTGFPHSDTDIYANKLSHAWDDAIEAEGANKNVRIWGNYIDQTAIGIATTVTATGPVYIFRNVYNRSRFFEKKALDADERQPFFKSGSDASLGNGRRYVFHNTMLQASDGTTLYGLGAGAGMGGTGSAQLVNNTVSKNNIHHLWKPNSAFYQVGTGNDISHEMYNGSPGTTIINGINATPVYAAGNGWTSEASGQYQLAAGTPGFDVGTRIANFNDAHLGGAPDVGAHESGSAAMKFGLAAADATPPAPPPPPPPPGLVNPSSTLASSANPSTAGQGVTFTATFSGSAGTPTGTVNFLDGATAISGCAAVTLSNGSASCTTSGLAAGSHAVTATYSGNASYNPATSPAVTQTVNSTGGGTASASLGIDSSSYTITAGQSVTFTVTLSGNAGTPTGTINFRTGSTSISGCSAMPITSATASCTTTSLAAGSHPVTGLYSGDGNYGAGVAGPITQTVLGTAVSPTLTIDSSRYTSNVGQNVTFTVRLSGSAGTPTGTVTFRDGTVLISGCSSVPVSSGTARCTTKRLAAGTHAIRGWYSGSANYSAGVAGPITQTVQ